MPKLLKKIRNISLIFLLTLGAFTPCLAVDTPDQVMGDTDLIKNITEGSSLDGKQTSSEPIAIAVLNVVHMIRNILAAVGILLICYFAVRILSSRKAISENVEKSKEGIKQTIMGLVGIMLLDTIITGIFGTDGQAWTNQNQSQIQQNSDLIIDTIHNLGNFIMSLASTLAVFVIVFSSVQMVFSFEDPGTIEKRKKAITYSMIGLLVMAFANAIVNKVIFGEKVKSEGGYILSAQNGINEILGITNYILMFISFLAVGFLVYGGIRMILARGDDGELTKAKSIMLNAVIGLIIALCSYAIVVTFVMP